MTTHRAVIVKNEEELEYIRGRNAPGDLCNEVNTLLLYIIRRLTFSVRIALGVLGASTASLGSDSDFRVFLTR